LYARRLDKIYTKHGKSPMLPKVVKKMRTEYGKNPHKFYEMVCRKYGETPEKKIDAYRLVYGRTEFEEHDWKLDKNKRENEEKESKENEPKVWEEEPPTPEEEEEEEEEEDEDEEEEENEPEPPKSEKKYKFEMPKRRPSPRFESSRHNGSSPRNERRYAPSLPKTNYEERSSSRRQLDSPRYDSPRALYPFHRKEELEYVNVQPGDIVETMVLMANWGDESGFWTPARILSINEKKEVMDLEVLEPKKYGLARRAVGVPYRYIRKPDSVVWLR